MLFSTLRHPQTLRVTVSRAFLASLLASPEGRAYVLTQAAIAEGTDEGAIFDHVAKRVGDPELHRMVKKHAHDEERHAALFFACADRQGVPRPHIPEHLRVLTILDRRLGVFGRPMASDRDVMDAYLVLQVIEERAIEQFSMVEPVMRRFDTQTADAILSIAKDEERHLRYCRAISKRYAPSDEERTARLVEFREAEAVAFREHQQASVEYMLTQHVMPAGPTWFWGNVLGIFARRNVVPYTRFHHEHRGEVALAA